MKYLIKIVLALLLFGCLLQMPYGYYQFIRWACCAGFIYLTYEDYKIHKEVPVLAVLYAVGAILFNPLAPIHFDRITWNAIDVTVAVLLIVWMVAEIIIDLKSKTKQT